MSRQRRSPGGRSPAAGEDGPARGGSPTQATLRSLCLSNIPSRITDHALCKIIERDWSRYPHFQVNITTHNGERVAYLNFRHPDEAQTAIDRMQNYEIESCAIHIRPIYNWDRKWSTNQMRRSRSPVSHHRWPMSRNDSPSFESEKPSKSVSPRSSQRERLPSENFGTRTLFIGNLPNDVDEDALMRMFSKYGQVHDLDIKKQGRGISAYAFIRFSTLEMATRAKLELHSQVINGYPMKIGFGKQAPTVCIWIGGLGPWVTFDELEKEILRFGSVSRIEWPRNKNYAFVMFHTQADSTNMLDQLRSLKFSDKKVIADYTDISYFKQNCQIDKSHVKRHSPRSARHRRSTSRQTSPSRHLQSSRQRSPSRHRWSLSHQSSPPRHRRSQSRPLSPIQHWRSQSKLSGQTRTKVTLSTAKDIIQISECLKAVWAGKVILKKSKFGCRFFRLRGDETLIEDYLFEEKKNSFQQTPLSLKVTQTMVMEDNVLHDINKMMDSLRSKHFCALVATSYVLTTTLIDDALQPQQPLKNLIDYLRLKNSSGVVTLPPPNLDNNDACLLHIFPPCDFVYDILRQKAPNLLHNSFTDDFVLILFLHHVKV